MPRNARPSCARLESSIDSPEKCEGRITGADNECEGFFRLSESTDFSNILMLRRDGKISPPFLVAGRQAPPGVSCLEPATGGRNPKTEPTGSIRGSQ
jgi:hypothetical protein